MEGDLVIFKSRQVNLDPDPYVIANTELRVSSPSATAYIVSHFDPRPEFEPTRDPAPWRFVYDEPMRAATAERDRRGWHNDGQTVEWAPRREQFDTPVNPILVEFRASWGSVAYDGPRDQIASWLAALKGTERTIKRRGYSLGSDPTPEQIDHARKVLNRLAHWSQS